MIIFVAWPAALANIYCSAVSSIWWVLVVSVGLLKFLFIVFSGLYGANSWESGVCDMILDTAVQVIEAAKHMFKSKTDELKVNLFQFRPTFYLIFLIITWLVVENSSFPFYFKRTGKVYCDETLVILNTDSFGNNTRMSVNPVFILTYGICEYHDFFQNVRTHFPKTGTSAA